MVLSVYLEVPIGRPADIDAVIQGRVCVPRKRDWVPDLDRQAVEEKEKLDKDLCDFLSTFYELL